LICLRDLTFHAAALELEACLTPDDEQKADLAVMMKDMEALLARVG